MNIQRESSCEINQIAIVTVDYELHYYRLLDKEINVESSQLI